MGTRHGSEYVEELVVEGEVHEREIERGREGEEGERNKGGGEAEAEAGI